MADQFGETVSIEMPCPGCGQKTAKTIAWLKTHDQLVCACGATISLDTKEFTRNLLDVERALDDLRQSERRARGGQ